MREDKAQEAAMTDKANEGSKDKAAYLYGVAESGEKTSLGRIGLAGEEVYTIPFNDLCAVVHTCPPQPYKSEDNEVVKGWVLTHEKVVETAWERFGTILPAGFDTIIKGQEDDTSEENIKKWLKLDYTNLKVKLDKMRDKAEYVVQIFWDPMDIADVIAKTDPEIRNLNLNMQSKSPGMAYMLKHQSEIILKREMEKKAGLCFEDFYVRIKKCVDEIRVEKIKKMDKKKQMIMNLSCLVDRRNSKQLGEELEIINDQEGFSVRYTGPWPPYSFVTLG